MAILPKIQENEASPEVRESYTKVKARYGGFLPDIYKAFANDPEYLDSLNDHMARVLKPRKVDAKTKEVIALVVAAINDCDFWLNAHAGFGHVMQRAQDAPRHRSHGVRVFASATVSKHNIGRSRRE